MLPCHEAAKPDILNTNQDLTQKVCNKILSAIFWLHEQHFVHRDIRWDNIVLHNGSAVLIDFCSAIGIASLPSKVEYHGGYVCCPPRLLIGQSVYAPYTPRIDDNYHAYILLINSILFPKSMWDFSPLWLRYLHPTKQITYQQG